MSCDGFITSKIDSARLSKCRRKGRMCEPVMEATLSGSSNMCKCYKFEIEMILILLNLLFVIHENTQLTQ